MAEQLAAFKEAVRLGRLLTERDGRFDCPTVDYMVAIRRVHAAFGLFRDRDHPSRQDWDGWSRVHAAIVRWSDVPASLPAGAGGREGGGG